MGNLEPEKNHDKVNQVLEIIDKVKDLSNQNEDPEDKDSCYSAILFKLLFDLDDDKRLQWLNVVNS